MMKLVRTAFALARSVSTTNSLIVKFFFSSSGDFCTNKYRNMIELHFLMSKYVSKLTFSIFSAVTIACVSFGSAVSLKSATEMETPFDSCERSSTLSLLAAPAASVPMQRSAWNGGHHKVI